MCIVVRFRHVGTEGHPPRHESGGFPGPLGPATRNRSNCLSARVWGIKFGTLRAASQTEGFTVVGRDCRAAARSMFALRPARPSSRRRRCGVCLGISPGVAKSGGVPAGMKDAPRYFGISRLRRQRNPVTYCVEAGSGASRSHSVWAGFLVTLTEATVCSITRTEGIHWLRASVPSNRDGQKGWRL